MLRTSLTLLCLGAALSAGLAGPLVVRSRASNNGAAIAGLHSNSPRQDSNLANVSDETGVLALDQVFREFRNPFTIVEVAARQTDIDEGTVAYYRKKLGARVILLMVTRGEGSPSPTRPELGTALGELRTRETLATARLIGADVFFLNLRDFGVSQTGDEALRVWGHDEAVKRMVRAFRLLHPDVVITSDREDRGDGIQRAVAKLTREAFDRSASASPPLEQGLDAWQPKRLFQRLELPEAAVAPDIVQVRVTEYDTLRGLTFAESGLRARRVAESWGATNDQMTPDRQRIHYRLIAAAGDSAAKKDQVLTLLTEDLSLPERLIRALEAPRLRDLTAGAISNRDEVIEALKERLIEKRVEGDVEQLRGRYGADAARVVRFTQSLERALALVIGLSVNVSVSDDRVTPGQSVTARVDLINESERAYPIVIRLPSALSVEGQRTWTSSETIESAPHSTTSRAQTYQLAVETAPTVPHAEHLREQEYYGIGTTLPGSQPSEPFGATLAAAAEVDIGQAIVPLSALERFDIVPPVEITTIPRAFVTDWDSSRPLQAQAVVRNNTPGPLSGALWIVPLAVTDDDYEPLHLSFIREGEQKTVTLSLKLPVLKPPLSPDVLIEFRRENTASTAAGTASQSQRQSATLASTKIEIESAGIKSSPEARVGFIAGLDQSLETALTGLGIEHSEIPTDAIATTEHGNGAQTSQSVESCSNLSRYSTIIVDEQAWSSHPQVLDQIRCLLRYARQGGNLVLLSQEPDDWRLLASRVQLMPFPVALSTNRLTNNASVAFLDAEQELLTRPNRISSKDFDGWVTELAWDVPASWSDEYKPLLEVRLPDGTTNRGTLLVARYGAGTFVYVTLSLRRQLIAGSPGAFRLLANLTGQPAIRK
ncbi:MAG TPA: PIG-L family deacetylase [Blastocatellia bacterium]|nr:PIG-L family deacetylase [Blastocatellia bacterium]